MICNDRALLCDSRWTRIQRHLGYKSIIDYIIADQALMKALSNVFKDRTDIGSLEHYLLWFQLRWNFGIQE